MGVLSVILETVSLSDGFWSVERERENGLRAEKIKCLLVIYSISVVSGIRLFGGVFDHTNLENLGTGTYACLRFRARENYLQSMKV